MVGLAEQLLPYAGAATVKLSAEPALEESLAALLASVREAWPGVELPAAVFLRHLAGHIATSADPVGALGALHGADLYLACACAHGDAAALRILEARFLGPLAGYLRRREPSPAGTDEILQALRASLLVAEGAGPPRIASFAGQGPLTAWLRIVAARLAGRLRRGAREEAAFDSESPLQLRSPAPDPELAYLKTRYRAELEGAFRVTLAALPPRERTILRLHFLDGMNAQAIAAAYKVSKRTAERWIAQIREGILGETRRLLGEKLHMEPSQLDTLMGLVQSELDVNVSQILRQPGLREE